MQIRVLGKASGKETILTIAQEHFNLSLLEFLSAHDIPIASSCSGAGQCEKCVTSSGKLTCQIKCHLIKDGDEFLFDYL